MTMNKHDERRKQALIKTLRKAKEQADTAYLYLDANSANFEDREPIAEALDHIEIVLEKLAGDSIDAVSA